MISANPIGEQGETVRVTYNEWRQIGDVNCVDDALFTVPEQLLRNAG